jgi:hypothetical protein
MSRSRLFSNEAEINAFFARLRDAVYPERYGKKDRARDFIVTFEGDSGQRVLAQIANFCRPFDGPNDADKPGRLAFHAGQRYVLWQIMKCFESDSKEVVKEESPDVSE